MHSSHIMNTDCIRVRRDNGQHSHTHTRRLMPICCLRALDACTQRARNKHSSSNTHTHALRTHITYACRTRQHRYTLKNVYVCVCSFVRALTSTIETYGFSEWLSGGGKTSPIASMRSRIEAERGASRLILVHTIRVLIR